MGLSNITNPKEQVSTYQVLLEISQRLAELSSDPKALDKAIQSAYSLTDSEKLKAEEARSDIFKNQKLIDEQKVRAADLEAEQDNIDLRKSELEKFSKTLNERDTQQNSHENKLNEKSRELEQLQKDIARGQSDLQAGIENLEQNKSKLKADRELFEQDKADLKAREDKLKALLG